MPGRNCLLLAALLLTLLVLLLFTRPVLAQGAVTPSFGDGQLTILGEGYRAGERVEIRDRVGGQSHQFAATADGRGLGSALRKRSELALEDLEAVDAMRAALA